MFTAHQRVTILLWSGIIFLLSLLLPLFFHAEVLTASSITSNGHFPRDIETVPLQFHTDPFGRITAHTPSGTLLRQTTIINQPDTYLERIDIDGAFFYVSDQGVFSAASDTAAASAYVAQATPRER